MSLQSQVTTLNPAISSSICAILQEDCNGNLKCTLRIIGLLWNAIRQNEEIVKIYERVFADFKDTCYAAFTSTC